MARKHTEIRICRNFGTGSRTGCIDAQNVTLLFSVPLVLRFANMGLSAIGLRKCRIGIQIFHLFLVFELFTGDLQ